MPPVAATSRPAVRQIAGDGESEQLVPAVGGDDVVGRQAVGVGAALRKGWAVGEG